MSGSLSSLMIRSATKKASVVVSSRSLPLAGFKASVCQDIMFPAFSKNFHTSVQKMDDNSDSHGLNDSQILHPEPLVALAYEYDDDDGREAYSLKMSSSSTEASKHDVVCRSYESAGTSSSSNLMNYLSFSSGGRIPNLTPQPSSQFKLTKRKASGGGGGTGRYRCPKCGTHVTFRHGDFEENTFYCATCSGWFLVTPNTISGEGKEGEFIAQSRNGTDGSKIQGPEILMQHVSIQLGYFSHLMRTLC